MPLFKVPDRGGKSKDSELVKKVNGKRTSAASVPGGGGLLEIMTRLKSEANTIFGEYVNIYKLVTEPSELEEFLIRALYNGVISIDTETTGLDPLLDSIVGFSLATQDAETGQIEAIYVPINHVSYVTMMPIPNQMPLGKSMELLNMLYQPGMEVGMFNAPFDIRVLRHAGWKNAYCTWDCYLGARCLNENEPANNLKELHLKYCRNNVGDAFVYNDLFNGITFNVVPLSIAYLYGAHDAHITLEYMNYQKPFLSMKNPVCKKHHLEGVASVFHNIEMPIVDVVANMEDRGIAFDLEYNRELQTKYHAILDEAKAKCYAAIDVYSDKLAQWRKENPDNKLSDPVNIGSPVQLAILFYDVLKLPAVDDKKPRGTGEDILQKLNHPIGKAILEYRGLEKIVNTYIDKLPECVNPNDGRIHCKFNQYGADTGRFSCKDPNLQNIPSHNKDIRKAFVASPGYVLLSADYGQQEPKVATQMCGDPDMMKAYQEGKDLYSQIASLAFNVPYEQCLEHFPDGTVNPSGKERRSQAKSILLGVLYGRGIESIAEQLNTTKIKAQRIKDSVFKGFPAIPKFEEDSKKLAIEQGFVTTLWGRKRRLPDMQLPDYELVWKDGAAPDSDLLDFDDDSEVDTEVPEEYYDKYIPRLRKAFGRQKRKIYEEANAEGIYVIDNTKKIADTERKIVNSRIQGSAADMTKLAMILVDNDERLKELGFRLLLPVHDELIAECPRENVKEVIPIFSQLMSDAATSKLDMPIYCDVEVSERWYGDTIEV